MNGKDPNGFVARRAEALSQILLSSRPDLTVMSAPEHSGVDLIVSIVKKKVNAFVHFGVMVKGTSQEIPNPAQATRLLNSIAAGDVSRPPLSMPACIFFFSMVQDHGYYAWLREPETSRGLPRLRDCRGLQCKRLDQIALESIVDAVDSYFDALARVLIS
jgi:hypothetical protein